MLVNPPDVCHVLVIYDGSAAMVDEQLTEAQVILGSYGRSAHFAAVEGDGARAVRRTAEALGCDLVLVPAHGLFPDRLARRCRRAGCARVSAVRAE